MSTLFVGMAFLLTAVATYWIFGRGTPRPTGSLAIGALLASFALAFAAYTPLLAHAADRIFPRFSLLTSNFASMAAATSIVAASFQVNLEPAEARRRIRLRLALATVFFGGMAALFVLEGLTAPSARAYALYLGLFISYLSFAIVDFLRQALKQSESTRRGSIRLGLRLAAFGCVFGLVYAAYKTTVLVSLALGLHLVPDQRSCSSLVTPPCVFSVTSPALAVLLIGVGLTLPAVAYPIGQARRRRWETRSFVALEPLWRDLTAAMPEIVLSAPYGGVDMAPDPGFLLQRRVVEISDGLLALRPYRSQKVLEIAQEKADTGTERGAAFVEAALTRAALAALRSGQCPAEMAEAPASIASARAGDLRTEADWLVAVAANYELGDTLEAGLDAVRPAGTHWSLRT